jgi:hypothetical protein
VGIYYHWRRHRKNLRQSTFKDFHDAMNRFNHRPPSPPSRITDNSEPWIKNPSSVAEFWEIACRVNETVAKWAPPQDNSSKS